MSDQCAKCTIRGKLETCLTTDCSGHDSWIFRALKKRSEELEDDIDSLYLRIENLEDQLLD